MDKRFTKLKGNGRHTWYLTLLKHHNSLGLHYIHLYIMELMVVGVCDRWTLVYFFPKKKGHMSKKTFLKEKHVTKERGNSCEKTRNYECNGRGN